MSRNDVIEWQSLGIMPTSMLHQYWCVSEAGELKY